ncbi:MAG: FMN-binding protein [Spirochaetaceae bacterium]|jgi:uncharacterized protein with FMN-binding domain|nr:FMN-binding protein [Spirochaetaceae bacterium]
MKNGVSRKGGLFRRGRLLIMAAGLLSALTAVSGCAGGPSQTAGRFARHTPGIYEGFGQGYRGPVHVLVRTSPGGILGIEILEHGDDAAVGGAAMEELLELVLEANSTELDAVSGATESSAGFLAAVEDALAASALAESAGL